MRAPLLVTITVPLLLLTFLSKAQSYSPDWNEGALVPPGGRANIYQWQAQDFFTYQKAGKIHAQLYPVDITGMLPPYQPIRKFLGDSFFADLGLHPYPKTSDQGVYQMPYPNDVRPETRVGFGLIRKNGADGFTFSCAACHSANLFGKTVLGMTNRFPGANGLFVKAKKAMPLIDPWIFKVTTGASDAEAELLRETKSNLRRVAVKKPIQLGLDTSLAQVALSLNLRSPDSEATPSDFYEEHPREDAILDKHPADSKPAVWWNVKYKDRWLSDGSVISGNPIFTNILWNEIGRGTDLSVLKQWLSENKKIIDELTTAVFSSEAPKMTDFFPAEKIDLMMAKKGQALFNNNCARCHGVYEKAWDLPYADQLSPKQKLETTLVKPRPKTPVVDVGTDPARRVGMKPLEQLNNLAISKENGIVIKAQNGYVPPPLVGIWARWPYFHNNSVPSLCAVLTPGAQRPVVYYAGEANDPNKDFDFDCNGYPLGDKTPRSWRSAKFYYDTRREGMSNQGHDKNILLDENGKEIYSPEDKKAIIRFLQTL